VVPDSVPQDETSSHQSSTAEMPQRRSGESLYRRQISHDIRHELGTIALLASALKTSQDVGQDSQLRAAQILAETKWLEELIRVYEHVPDGSTTQRDSDLANTRLDLVTGDILRPLRLSSRAKITMEATAVTAHVDRLELWRALRNVICNALEAAGDDGCLAIRISSSGRMAVVEIEDDGPGFDPASVTPASLGLAIVVAFVRKFGGRLTISQGTLGGCAVRLHLPRAD